MSKKTTKRALAMSFVSVFLCVCMLVGTTFAWFTDSVTSSNNIIKSGTLDVTMEWADGKLDPATATYTDASAGAIFNNDLWEPGYTEVRHIKISNEGSLALKYQLNIIPNGVVSELANVIDVYFIDPANKVASRTDLDSVTPIGTLAQVLAGMPASTSAELLKGESDTVTIALKMQESATNEYQDLSIGSDFSVVLMATQKDYESDSFDELYDDIALVSDADELKAAIAGGKNVTLTADIAADANNTITVADDADIVLDLNGHKITATSSAIGSNRALFTVKGEMSVIGNGTVSMVHTAANMEWNNLSAPFSVEAGVLTLGKGVNVMNFGGTDMAYAVDVNTTLGETELNVDGATLYSTYIGVRIFNNHSTAKGVVNYNSGIIYGAKNGYDIWAQLMNNPAENAVVNIADGINYTTEAKSGTMYYVEDDVAFVSNYAGLTEAIKNGGEVVLVNDIVMNNSASLSNADFVLDGNGHTITMADGATNTYALFDITCGKATIKDVTFDGIKEGAIVRTVGGVEFNADNVTAVNGNHTQVQGIFRLNGKSTITDCTFKNNTCNMVISLNYDGANNDPQVVKNCVFENNTCNATGVLYYVKGASCTLDGNKFVGNTVNCNVNGATVYMGFTENNTITNNVFKNNVVKDASTSKRVAGALMVGYETVITNNAFIDNKVEGTNAKGNDVCASVYYTDIDLSGNYWGGEAPVENDNYFVEYPDNNNVIINDYLTTYSN